MKKIFFLCILFSALLFAQNKMYIHKSDNITLGIPLSSIDSIGFNSASSVLFLNSGDSTTQFSLSNVDSISFADDSDTVYINYDGNSVSVNNPFAFEGISVVADEAFITVTSTTAIENINYKLSGTTDDGNFKIYSNTPFSLILNSTSITNSTGPAINIQSKQEISVTLVNGSTNSLTDGSSYSDTYVNGSGESEDQKADFYSNGTLIFSGTGGLTINGTGEDKHGLYSKDFVEITSVTIELTSSSKDGIHANDGIIISGGIIIVNSTEDALDADAGYIQISGGSITAETSDEGADGVVCDGSIDVSNATINVTVNRA